MVAWAYTVDSKSLIDAMQQPGQTNQQVIGNKHWTDRILPTGRSIL